MPPRIQTQAPPGPGFRRPVPAPFAMVAFLRRAVLRTVMALCLCLSLALTACSASGTGLTGNYVDDTVRTAQTLLTTGERPELVHHDADRAQFHRRSLHQLPQPSGA